MKATHLTIALALLRQASALIQLAPEDADEAQACQAIDGALEPAIEALLAEGAEEPA